MIFLSSGRLNPFWVSGFSDGESTFHVRVERRKGGLNWKIEPIFKISLHKIDLPLLYQIQSFFGNIGRITSSRNSVNFTISRLQDLNSIIIPHFLNYPLLTKKSIDFYLFSQVIKLMRNKEHLSLEGLKLIVQYKSAMNNGLSDQLKSAFPEILTMERPINNCFNNPLNNLINPNWLSGFTCGEGCFSIYPNRNYFTIEFALTQHARDIELLQKIQEYLNCGIVGALTKKTAFYFRARSLRDCSDVIIPHFDSYPLLGWKERNYKIWREIILIIQSGAHLTPEGKDKIIKLRKNLNKYENF